MKIENLVGSLVLIKKSYALNKCLACSSFLCPSRGIVTEKATNKKNEPAILFCLFMICSKKFHHFHCYDIIDVIVS